MEARVAPIVSDKYTFIGRQKLS